MYKICKVENPLVSFYKVCMGIEWTLNLYMPWNLPVPINDTHIYACTIALTQNSFKPVLNFFTPIIGNLGCCLHSNYCVHIFPVHAVHAMTTMHLYKPWMLLHLQVLSAMKMVVLIYLCIAYFYMLGYCNGQSISNVATAQSGKAMDLLLESTATFSLSQIWLQANPD